MSPSRTTEKSQIMNLGYALNELKKIRYELNPPSGVASKSDHRGRNLATKHVEEEKKANRSTNKSLPSSSRLIFPKEERGVQNMSVKKTTPRIYQVDVNSERPSTRTMEKGLMSARSAASYTRDHHLNESSNVEVEELEELQRKVIVLKNVLAHNEELLNERKQLLSGMKKYQEKVQWLQQELQLTRKNKEKKNNEEEIVKEHLKRLNVDFTSYLSSHGWGGNGSEGFLAKVHSKIRNFISGSKEKGKGLPIVSNTDNVKKSLAILMQNEEEEEKGGASFVENLMDLTKHLLAERHEVFEACQDQVSVLQSQQNLRKSIVQEKSQREELTVTKEKLEEKLKDTVEALETTQTKYLLKQQENKKMKERLTMQENINYELSQILINFIPKEKKNKFIALTQKPTLTHSITSDISYETYRKEQGDSDTLSPPIALHPNMHEYINTSTTSTGGEDFLESLLTRMECLSDDLLISSESPALENTPHPKGVLKQEYHQTNKRTLPIAKNIPRKVLSDSEGFPPSPGIHCDVLSDSEAEKKERHILHYSTITKKQFPLPANETVIN